jgi:hypothetical protein
MMNTNSIYHERLTSTRTTALFIFLALLFSGLFIYRFSSEALDGWAVLWAVLGGMFIFYVFNYRALTIEIDKTAIRLRFGLLGMRVEFHEITACETDTVSLWRIGGAGIHFSPMGGRYRAMFNFLEYPRLVLRLNRKRGWIWDVAFSTRNPDEVMALVRKYRLMADTKVRLN